MHAFSRPIGIGLVHVLIIPTGIYPLPELDLSTASSSTPGGGTARGGDEVGVLSGGVITTRYLGRRFPYARQDLVNGVPVYRAHRGPTSCDGGRRHA